MTALQKSTSPSPPPSSPPWSAKLKLSVLKKSLLQSYEIQATREACYGNENYVCFTMIHMALIDKFEG